MKPVSSTRRALLASLAAAPLALPLAARAQGAYPNRPLKIIVPLPPSGAADVSVRLLGEAMQASMGQTINVENRPGGAYAIGMQAINSAAPDGYTVIHLNSTMCSVQAAYKRIDITRLTPIAHIGSTDFLMLAANNAPFKTIAEMVTWAKANPGRLTSGIIGPGSSDHLAMLILGQRYGFSANFIPFKGGPDGALALAQGELMVMPLAAPLLLQLKDKVRPLASLVEQRNALAPDAPTMRELGYELPALRAWGGFAAPAGTPKEAVDVFARHVANGLDQPGVKQRYVSFGLVPQYLGGAELARIIEQEIKWQADTIKAFNLSFN